MKKILAAFAVLVVMQLSTATSAQAAIIEFLSTDFVGVNKSSTSNVATITAWDTETGIDGGTTFTAATVGSTDSANYFNAQSAALAADARVWFANQGWDVSFTGSLAAGTTSIDLDTLDLTSFVTSNSGTYRSTSNTDRSWTLTITGDNGYGTQSASTTTTFNQPPNAPTLSTIDLSSLGDLVANENYTFTLGVRYVNGDQTYMALDSIAFNGEVIPEPASLVLLGIGSLLIAGRRRRA